MNNPSSERGVVGGPVKSPGRSNTNNVSNSSSLSAAGNQASGAVREVAADLKAQMPNVVESAKDLASQAGEKLLSSVEEQKAAGAELVSGVAGAMRRAANEFGEVPQAAQYIRLAADQIDSVSDAFRKRDLNQLVSDVQGFARRQPTAFLGAAVLAGFAVVRFLKTSTGATAGRASDSRDSSARGSKSMAGYQTGSSSNGRSQPTGL